MSLFSHHRGLCRLALLPELTHSVSTMTRGGKCLSGLSGVPALTALDLRCPSKLNFTVTGGHARHEEGKVTKAICIMQTHFKSPCTLA